MSESRTIASRGIVKEGAILAGLFSLVLVLPIAIYFFFSKEWMELSWHSTVDLSMLEWTGAFLNTFLFLLFIEQFRLTYILNYVLVACGFLAMGLMGFFYVVTPLGTEFSFWLKEASLLLGGVWFGLCPFFTRREEKDFVRVFFRYIFPTIVVTFACCGALVVLKPLLPRLMSNDMLSINTLPARLVALVIAIFFFTSSVYWLRRYLAERRSEALTLSIMILLYAQMAVVVVFLHAWGVLWWGWHTFLVLNSLWGASYLLLVCVRRSLSWRLLLSLGLSFGITIVIATAIIQVYTDSLFDKILSDKLYDRHRQLLSGYSFPVSVAKNHLLGVERILEKTLGQMKGTRRDMLAKARMLVEAHSINWPNLSITTNVVLLGSGGDEKAVPLFVRRLFGREVSAKTEGTIAHSFFFDKKTGALDMLLAVPLHGESGRRLGYVYSELDLSALRKGSIVPNQTDRFGEGRVVFDKRDGSVLFQSLPYYPDEDLESRRRIPENFVKKLVAGFIHLKTTGEVSDTVIQGHRYFIFANPLPETNLVILDIIARDHFPSTESQNLKYVIIAVGMASLLVGFIILLLFLNYQLARPLRRIIDATKHLDDGDFSMRINSTSLNELGVLSRTFDNMVVHLRSLYLKLEKTVEQRTVALNIAKQVNQSQSEFFENISHKLRTPLHSILSFSTFGLDPKKVPQTEKGKEYFSIVNRSAKGLLTIINELLELIKIGDGQMTLAVSKVNLYVAVLQAYRGLQGKFEKRRVKLICDKPEFDPVVKGDRHKIETVFHNLLDNAAKVSIENSTVKVDFIEEDEFVIVSILDEGPGVPKNDPDILFEKYVRFDRTDDDEIIFTPSSSDSSILWTGEGAALAAKRAEKSSAFKGAGLGLFTSREIVLLHRGEITAGNRAGKGAVFTVKLPKENERSFEFRF